MHACVCVCVCVCAYVHMHWAPSQTPWQSQAPQEGDPWNLSKVNKNLTNQDISILFADFKFVKTPPPTHTHIHNHPPHPPHPPPRGRPPNLLKHDKTWMNQDISILFEDLKFVNHPTHTDPHPYPLTPPTQKVGTSNQLKCDKTWTNQDISILFKDLKSVKTPLPIAGCIFWWVGG